jgi:hypothetical protein
MIAEQVKFGEFGGGELGGEPAVYVTVPVAVTPDSVVPDMPAQLLFAVFPVPGTFARIIAPEAAYAQLLLFNVEFRVC